MLPRRESAVGDHNLSDDTWVAVPIRARVRCAGSRDRHNNTQHDLCRRRKICLAGSDFQEIARQPSHDGRQQPGGTLRLRGVEKVSEASGYEERETDRLAMAEQWEPETCALEVASEGGMAAAFALPRIAQIP